jgi:hypothetical protein
MSFRGIQNRFNGFQFGMETVETVFGICDRVPRTEVRGY